MGELEQAVMHVLWQLGEEERVTVRDVHASLSGRSLAYTTVMTVMARLARKGYVEQEREGRAYRYRPRLTRAELTAELMREALAGAGQQDRDRALVSFVEEATPADLEALRRALDDVS